MSERDRRETDLYTVVYDDDIDAVVFYWDEYSTGERFKSGAMDLLEYIKEHDARKLIVNTRGIKAHNEEETEWLQEEWMPKIFEAGIEHSVTVHRDSVISEMDMEEFYEGMEDVDDESAMTDDMDEAREWIAEK
ncbi:hypothetical protein [Halorhabdus sp. BNX81]|uniref:hypothetical protein n=1 Tax=Halorhabdus sp. BNX81 TaxID=2980181 RepID=UPI0023DD3CC7|nr:hypothetical protein [Halorhabdus sp. BNX81]WEL20506.1 Uncharacterized protein HBNXHr_0431 [Halorhabdus sp. BNX81]